LIRVNLLKNRVGDAVVPTAGAADAGSSDARELVVKVVFIFLFMAGLVVYENHNIGRLNAERIRVSAQVRTLEEEEKIKAKEADSVKDVEIQAKELEDKLKIMKLLSKLRLREVKTLDFMQSSIPEKVWLKSISYETGKGKVEEGHYQFVGTSTTTEDLTEFVKRLEDSSYFYEVIVVKNQEMVPSGRVSGSSATTRDFIFTAQVEFK